MWRQFLDSFLTEENQKESQALGDVDPNAPEEDNYEFLFSLDAIKRKYMDYLQLGPGDFESVGEDAEEEREADEEREPEPAPDAEAEEKEQINTEELIDAIKKLDIGNEEETAYVDINYWKTGMSCDVDDLLEELGKGD